ncbi:MAG: vWA domain-containing protein [Chloroflexota bacterium]|nr:vWA domain-containing protein [Chloroflexota bacterium]
MKKLKIVAAAIIPLLLILALVVPGAANGIPPVTPQEVMAELAPGESMTVDKSVITPPIPPNPDIYFLADTTGSMGEAIAAVQTDASSIMTSILTVQPTAQFGVGNYRDYPGTVHPFQNQQAITADTGAVSAAISAWSAGGGGDGPEGQFYALARLADLADPEGIGWRGAGSKIVVWFGDAPAHDPVPTAATGLGADITEATITADLVAANIKVIAISVVTAAGTYYPNALDDNPNNYGGDYNLSYGITENGTSGQASRIAAATSGVHLMNVEPDEIAEAILAGIEDLTTDVWWEVTYPAGQYGLEVTLDPAVYFDVPGGTTLPFTETIVVADDAPQCETLTALVTFYANHYPDEGAVIGRQKVAIYVKDITPPEVDAGPDVTVEQDRYQGAPAELPEPMVKDNCDPDPTVVIEGMMDVYPLGDTTITVTATDASGNTASDTVVVHVVDTTAPDLSCVESVNPHGNIIPGKNRPDKAEDKAKNPDGFYQLLAEDICDPEPQIFVSCDGCAVVFGPFDSGIVIKFTEAPGAAPSIKKIGSFNDQADSVACHITLPSEPVVTAVDFSGNVATCYDCLVPPPPK